MELLQLKYFCDASQTENFSETAQKFDVPASNISQTVHRLEKELGVSLFERSANRIRLNSDGKIFYEGVKKALLCLDRARDAVQDNGEIHGEIKICILTNRRIVTKVIGEFKKQYPEVSFRVKHFAARDVSDFDVIVGDAAAHPVGYTATKLVEERIMLAMHRNLLAGSENMKNLRYIAMQKDSSQHALTLELGKKQGFRPNIAIETDDPFYVREYVEMGLGAAVVPGFSWQGLFSEQVCFKELPDFTRTTFLYINRNRYMTPAVQKFHRALVKACKCGKEEDLLHLD